MDNNRTVIRVFFPEAREDMKDTTFLPKEAMEILYNEVVRPAAVESGMSDHYLRHWPPTYEGETMRARKKGSNFEFSGKSMRGSHLKNLVPIMRERVEGNPDLAWCRDMFFMVEIKGVKAQTTHEPPRESLLDDGMPLRLITFTRH